MLYTLNLHSIMCQFLSIRLGKFFNKKNPNISTARHGLGYRFVVFNIIRVSVTGSLGASLVAQMVKNLPANAEDQGLIPGSGRSSGERNSNSLQYSCLENPYGQRSLAGYSPLSYQRVGLDLATK